MRFNVSLVPAGAKTLFCLPSASEAFVRRSTMSCNYVVTAYKATAVSNSLTGNFTGPGDLNLIESKGNSLVVNLVTPEGLKPLVDVSINGRITIMQLFRLKGEEQDALVFMTAQYHLAVVSYDSSAGHLITRACGDVKERVYRPTESRQMGVIDPHSRIMVLHLYAGLLKVVPLDLKSDEQELKAFNVRMDDLYAIDMTFLQGFDQPTLAYLAEEPSGRCLKTVVISVKDKEINSGLWKNISVDSQASLLHPLPLPLGGLVAIGYQTIAYYNKDVQHAIDPPTVKESVITCVGQVDGSRCLLGDESKGRLLMLFVDSDEGVESSPGSGRGFTGMKLEVLGECSTPHCLAYLDNGVVFVGSRLGDSQLVKLTSVADDNSGSFVQVMETFQNIGPILDMSVVDLDKQGQDLIVSCSGYGKDGSLRVIRSGIGINEAASIDLAGVKGIWSLHCGADDSSLDNTLVVSFVGQTTVLSLCGEEVEETEIQSMAADQQTYYCSNVIGNRIIQITSSSVRLINEESLELVCKWEPPSGKNISTASCNSVQVIVAVGRELYYLEIQPDSLKLVSEATMEHEVACVDVTPLGDDLSAKSDLCAIGLWTDISVRLLKLPSLETIHTQPLGGDIIPRSILMVTFSGYHYLLCALGDGCLVYYQLETNTGQLSSSKKVVLGTKPIVLKLFRSAGVTNVFACSNHPTIIYTSNHKLLFSNVNLKEVNYLCTLNSEAFKDSLALVDDNTLLIGSVDQIQMLHIQTIPLGETPKRIAYQESSHSFAVVSCRIDVASTDDPKTFKPLRQSVSTTISNVSVSSTPESVTLPSLESSDETETFTVLLVDQNSFEVIHGYQLCQGEQAISLTSCILGESADTRNTFYVVGTAFVDVGEKEPTQGRVLVFQITDSKQLHLVHSQVKAGAIYQVVPFSSSKLAISVNHAVCVLSWNDDESALVEECSYQNNILSLFLKTKGDFILVGDLLRSMKLLVYKSDESKLEEIAVDISLNPVFLTAIEMIDDEVFLGADGRHLFICQKNSEAAVEEDLRYMLQPSRIYVGESVNVFQRGSLVMEHPGTHPLPIQGKPTIFGGVNGSIGIIFQLEPSVFELLSRLEKKMSRVIKSVSNIEHEVHRSCATEHKTMITEGFIDGDLVERFLDFSQTQMEEVCRGLKMTDSQGSEVDVQVDDVLKLVEDFSRLH